jgi:hypothetical protein
VIGLPGQLTAGLHAVAAVAEREFLAGSDGQGRVGGVEDQRDLGAPDCVLGLEQGAAADEVVAVGDRPAVAQLVRRDVIVLDVSEKKLPYRGFWPSKEYRPRYFR